MSDALSGIFSTTVPVVMAHPALLEPRKFKDSKGRESGEPKYSASFLFDPDSPDFKSIKGLALAIAKAKWPGRDIAADFKARSFSFPWSNGTQIADRRAKKLADAGKEDDHKGDFQRGFMVLKSSSKYQPRLSVIENGKIIDLEGPAVLAAKSKFYFGVLALAQFNFVAYEGVGQNPDGVTAYLNIVVSTNRGDKLTSSAQASEVFKGYMGSVSAEDPTAGDDDIPF